MKIAVYCGSSDGNDAAYVKTAFALGTWMGQNGCELVYGGSNTGLMGAVADGVLGAGGRVTGIVPNVPIILSRVHPGLTSLERTETLAERKTRMIALADAFIALPGGPGTLDEITEILSLRSLDLVRGPVIFYNVNGYYEPMKAVLAQILRAGFVRPEAFSGVVFAECTKDVADALRGAGESD